MHGMNRYILGSLIWELKSFLPSEFRGKCKKQLIFGRLIVLSLIDLGLVITKQ